MSNIRFLTPVLIVSALGLVTGCVSHAVSSSGSSSTIRTTVEPQANLERRVAAIADDYLRAWLTEFPDRALLNGLAIEHHDRLPDNSLDAQRRWGTREDAWLAQLARINPNTLWGRPEWVTHGLLRERLEASRAQRVCRQELWTVNQMSGWQVMLARLAQLQPLDTPELLAQALTRWRSLPQWLDTDLANLREGLRLGYSTPKRNVQLVVEQLDSILAAPERSPFFSPAERDSTPEFRAAWRALLMQEIVPAIRRYREYLAGDYLDRAREAMGVSANPDGAACWRASFRGYTTLDRSAEETYRIGERRVAQNLAEAKRIAEEKFGTADLDALRERVLQDRGTYFTGREELLTFAREAVERSRIATPRWFGRIPEAEVILEAHPAYLERSASDQYFAATSDGSRPAVYRINLYQPENKSRFAAETTAFHETFPGHHLQIGVARELPAVHPIGRIIRNSGLAEGWARYAEALAEEMGLYSEPYALISRRMWPARGMVIDPGVHIMGWTREQAVAYILAAGSMDRHRAEALVDRVVVWPAQLTAYDTGGLEFFALRERAERELGSRFDIREFHDFLLGHGTVSLPMLREVVERWLDEKR